MSFRTVSRIATRSLPRTALAIGAASYATYRLSNPVALDGPLDTVKNAASSVVDKAKSVSPLKPESPAGIPGAKTSHNPSTNMNHGQDVMSAASDAQQPDPVTAAQKKRQKDSNNTTDNDDKEQTAKQGGGTGAKIASGHTTDEDGQRVPNHEEIKPKKKKKSKKSKKASGSGEVEEALGEKKKEASQEEAFNEETGEINWDCPCLGGMAEGPCGEDFKAAFSCFVFSKSEPKGSECLEKFHAMQSCFKEHKEIYGDLAADPHEKAVN